MAWLRINSPFTDSSVYCIMNEQQEVTEKEEEEKEEANGGKL